MLRPPRSTLTDPLFPYTALFRSIDRHAAPIHSPGITRIHDARRRARRRQRACITGAFEGNPAPKLVEGSDAPHIGLAKRLAGEGWHPRGKRSEEHTSELQSLMRISYAVFCLKKKN